MIKSLSLLMLTLCLAPIVQAQTKISGTALDGAGKMMYLYRLESNEPILKDSTLINDKDAYQLKVKVSNTGFYRFGPSKEDFALLVLKPNTKSVVLESNYEGIGLSFDVVSGSEDTKLARDFLKNGRNYIGQRDSLQALYKTPGQDQMALRNEINGLGTAFLEKRNNYIDNNPKSPAVLMALPYIDPSNDYAYFSKVVKTMEETMPESFYAKALKEQESKLVVPGSMAPEIAVADPSGKVIKLSDLKGKVVLIDFWASWCRPCRAENPNVVRLYNKYKDSGFDVYSISMDKSKASWEGAIAADKLAWPNHVSELKHWQSTPGKAYGVSSIPHTVLVDKEGKIIALKIRGPQLEKELQKIFGF